MSQNLQENLWILDVEGGKQVGKELNLCLYAPITDNTRSATGSKARSSSRPKKALSHITGGFGCKRCTRWPQVPTVIWGHYYLPWATGTRYTSVWVNQSCLLGAGWAILLKAKWEIFHTLSMTNMFYPYIVKFQLQIVWTRGITHNLKTTASLQYILLMCSVVYQVTAKK